MALAHLGNTTGEPETSLEDLATAQAFVAGLVSFVAVLALAGGAVLQLRSGWLEILTVSIWPFGVVCAVLFDSALGNELSRTRRMVYLAKEAGVVFGGVGFVIYCALVFDGFFIPPFMAIHY